MLAQLPPHLVGPTPGCSNANKALVEKLFYQGFSGGNLTVLDDVMSALNSTLRLSSLSLDFSPVDAKIAPDFRCAPSLAHTLRASCGRPNLLLADLSRLRVPATESIAVATVEGQIVRMDNLHGDSRPQGCAQSLPLYGVEQGEGRNEHVPAGGKKTSEGASSAVCHDDMVNRLP